MDQRAELQGLDEAKQVCAAYARVASLAKVLPAAFSAQSNMSEEKRAQLLAGLCSSDYAQQVRELKSAYAAACSLPTEIKLSYKWPKPDGGVSDCTGAVPFHHWNLDQHLAKLDKVLATLCADIDALDKACKLADDLQTAIKACPKTHGSMHIYADGFHTARREYLSKAQRELAEGAQGIVHAAEHLAKGDGLFEHNGLLADLAKAWEKVSPPPQVEKPSPQLAIVIGASSRRRTSMIVTRDGESRPCAVPDAQAVFLQALATHDSAAVDRSVKSNLLGNIPELDGVILEADWPQGQEKPHNESRYRLDDAMRGRITTKNNAPSKRKTARKRTS